MPRVKNLSTFVCGFSINLVATLYWKTKGLFMPVKGQIYLLFLTSFLVRKVKTSDGSKGDKK